MGYKEKILNRLLDKYESSKTFAGQNSVRQNIALYIEKEFPEYTDNSNVACIKEIDEAIEILVASGLIECRNKNNGLVDKITLNLEKIETAYAIIKRRPKREINDELRELLNKYVCMTISADNVITKFCSRQIERLSTGKNVQHFSGNIDGFERLLKVLYAIENIENEIYEREFSARVLGDSKAFEKIRSTVISILYEYEDYPDKSCILEDLNVIRNPGHVFIKGYGEINLGGQKINLSKLEGDLAVSSSDLKNIEIKVTGKAAVTIENLTTFSSYKPDNELMIYLGGYHNSVRRDFIRRLYDQNKDVEYYHYGDIDAGGLYILRHLRKKTGVPFKPLHMDVDTLQKKAAYIKPLTENDVRRLKKLMDGESNEFQALITYMLEHNCKLEQEA